MTLTRFWPGQGLESQLLDTHDFAKIVMELIKVSLGLQAGSPSRRMAVPIISVIWPDGSD